MFKNACASAIILFAFLSTNLFAQSPANATAAQPAATEQPAAPADTAKKDPMVEAQKAYVAGNWKAAAAAYEQACPTLAEEDRPECYLWNILALSQTSNAKDFSKAGKRLDSLIQKTNPQHKVYADLMMTKAQFQLYMGRTAKAAEALIHAIETSQPHQVIVLKKICSAVQPAVKNPSLDEACKRLDEPRDTASAVTENKAVTAPEPKAEAKPEAKADSTSKVTDKIEPVTTKDTTKTVDTTKTEPAKVVPPPAVQPTNEYWYLQLGAFGVRSNAELLVSNLKKQGITGTIEERPGEVKTLYLVQTGHFDSKEKAIDYGAKKLAPLNVEFRALLRK